jgi:hypothetical protein
MSLHGPAGPKRCLVGTTVVMQLTRMSAERGHRRNPAIVSRPPPPTLWLMRAGSRGLNGERVP